MDVKLCDSSGVYKQVVTLKSISQPITQSMKTCSPTACEWVSEFLVQWLTWCPQTPVLEPALVWPSSSWSSCSETRPRRPGDQSAASHLADNHTTLIRQRHNAPVKLCTVSLK